MEIEGLRMTNEEEVSLQRDLLYIAREFIHWAYAGLTYQSPRIDSLYRSRERVSSPGVIIRRSWRSCSSGGGESKGSGSF